LHRCMMFSVILWDRPCDKQQQPGQYRNNGGESLSE